MSEKNQAKLMKVKVDLWKFSDDVHIYKLHKASESNRYIFHNVSTEDVVFGMTYLASPILGLVLRVQKYARGHLIPNSAKANQATWGHTNLQLNAWTVSQALVNGALNNETGEAARSGREGAWDFKQIDTIEREGVSMDDLVDEFTKQLYKTPGVLRGTIYQIELNPKLSLFFINLPSTLEFILFFYNRSDTAINVTYGSSFQLAPRQLHVVDMLHVMATPPLRSLLVDGKAHPRANKRKGFPEASALDTIEYTIQSFHRPTVNREVAVKVLKHCPGAQLSPKLSAIIVAQSLSTPG